MKGVLSASKWTTGGSLLRIYANLGMVAQNEKGMPPKATVRYSNSIDQAMVLEICLNEGDQENISIMKKNLSVFGI